MPSYWLLKSEPATYAFEDLVRDGRTVWDGVRNNQAAIYLRSMSPGDQALIYHSADVKACVGLAEIASGSFIDPGDPAGRFVAVEVKAGPPLANPVTLKAIKAEPALAGMAMIKLSRLSVSPVTPAEWAVILRMAG